MNIHSSKFDWRPATKTFVSEASDLRMQVPPHSFTVTSARTGQQAPFVLCHDDSNEEVWIFKPWNPTLLALGVTVKIFND